MPVAVEKCVCVRVCVYVHVVVYAHIVSCAYGTYMCVVTVIFGVPFIHTLQILNKNSLY